MEKQQAMEIKTRASGAIASLSAIITDVIIMDVDARGLIKKGVGMAIIAIDENILYKLYAEFPELSDLKD